MKINANVRRLIEELKLQDTISLDIQKIAQEICSSVEKEPRNRWLISVETIRWIGARYLDTAHADAVYRAYDKLKSYGVPCDKCNFSLELALGAYITEKCVEEGLIDKSFLELFENLDKEYWRLLNKNTESRS